MVPVLTSVTYLFQGYIGDPVDENSILGEMMESKIYLYPHLHFMIGYNGDQIVSVQISTDVRAVVVNCSCVRIPTVQ
jgi:hypothetical protein